MSRRNKFICSKTRSIEEFKPNNYEIFATFQTKIQNAVTPCVGSPEQLVDIVKVLLKLPLDVLQLVVVDGGVAPDADTRCQLLHERAHRFILASRRRPCNAQTPQDRGVDAVAVALDYLHAHRRTRVHNVSSLIHHKHEEDVRRLHGFAHKARKELLRLLRIKKHTRQHIWNVKTTE